MRKWVAEGKDIDLDGRRNGTFLVAPSYTCVCVGGGGGDIFHLCPMSYVLCTTTTPSSTPRSTLFWEVLPQSFVVFEKSKVPRVYTHICMYFGFGGTGGFGTRRYPGKEPCDSSCGLPATFEHSFHLFGHMLHCTVLQRERKSRANDGPTPNP